MPKGSSCSNNTNKFNPQEREATMPKGSSCSNNTNKFNPQEQGRVDINTNDVQIIQINSILKN